MTPIHNNKQNKGPLREEGVDFEKMKGGDRVLWVERRGKGDKYVEFRREDWEGLKGGGVRL
jgi:hypothetical protein